MVPSYYYIGTLPSIIERSHIDRLTAHRCRAIGRVEQFNGAPPCFGGGTVGKLPQDDLHQVVNRGVSRIDIALEVSIINVARVWVGGQFLF